MNLKRGPCIALQYVFTAPLVFMLVKFWNHEFSEKNDGIARSVVVLLSLFAIIHLSDQIRLRICTWLEKRKRAGKGDAVRQHKPEDCSE
jgi:hypothetical protein